ncbi:hypothetical protein BE221DRAFT_69771 [Ostreococcus tauri]|uniref:25S rRNA (uridine-N(3))-methyltransferase BMT5-like domain-containing protein n=1 Tax=Ostreococcus tauri TaxID=70448 RepID=A0A1Y5IEM9_OSTTA|nr:hypothetical protein BE221DRAFT_69771 [Ostreococcus tauri]
MARPRARARDAANDDGTTRSRKRAAIASTSAPPLFVGVDAVTCARNGCVPCRRIVFACAGETTAANARPEACPRWNATSVEGGKRVGLYARRRGRVLTVGDGDFTFSAALARTLGGKTIAATSYESEASLMEIYGKTCLETLRGLKERGVEVAHGVDASELAKTLPERCRKLGPFDAVVWNFPCVARDADGTAQEAALHGVDARSAEELEANTALVERFVAGAAELLAEDGGEIHITHKVGMQGDWNIEKAAASVGASGLVCAGAVVFDRMAYPGYRPRKALVAKSFPVTDARTFVFTNSTNGESVTLQRKSKHVIKVC